MVKDSLSSLSTVHYLLSHTKTLYADAVCSILFHSWPLWELEGLRRQVPETSSKSQVPRLLFL